MAVVDDDGETVRLEWRGNDPPWLTDFLEARAKRLDRAVRASVVASGVERWEYRKVLDYWLNGPGMSEGSRVDILQRFHAS